MKKIKIKNFVVNCFFKRTTKVTRVNQASKSGPSARKSELCQTELICLSGRPTRRMRSRYMLRFLLQDAN